MMNIDEYAFSHGQVISKIWLCEELEKCITSRANIYIFGGWYNVLGFMLLTRHPEQYETIVNIDIDPDAINAANKLCDAWVCLPTKVINIVGDCNEGPHSIPPSSVVINCSVEHFESNNWFFKLPKDTLVCIQSSNMLDPEHPWDIKQPSPDIDSFTQKFPVRDTLFLGEKRIQYDHFGYTRFMLIGRT